MTKQNIHFVTCAKHEHRFLALSFYNLVTMYAFINVIVYLVLIPTKSTIKMQKMYTNKNTNKHTDSNFSLLLLIACDASNLDGQLNVMWNSLWFIIYKLCDQYKFIEARNSLYRLRTLNVIKRLIFAISSANCQCMITFSERHFGKKNRTHSSTNCEYFFSFPCSFLTSILRFVFRHVYTFALYCVAVDDFVG